MLATILRPFQGRAIAEGPLISPAAYFTQVDGPQRYSRERGERPCEAPSWQPHPYGSCPGPQHPGHRPAAHPGSPTPPQASSLTLAQLGPKEGLPSRAEAELAAHDTGGDEIPSMVTDGAPLAVHEHLHPALAHLGPRAEAHLHLLLGEHLASGRVRRRQA